MSVPLHTMNPQIIPVTGRSQVVVGPLGDLLPGLLPQTRVVVISDTNIHRLYGHLFPTAEYILMGMGESSKTLATVEGIYRQLIGMGADRDTFILGMGGGIVTDVAGFVASTYMRGLDFGFIPTTLLAQVDASVGGKNGVNVDGFKNMAGVFNQPHFVICDPAFVDTLPLRETRAGAAEMIKAGIIADVALFELFERTPLDQLVKDKQTLTDAIVSAIKVKADIVARDEREGGIRRLLNLGHSFGHAIEKSTDKMLHGEAVGAGMALIADISVSMDVLSPTTAARIRRAIQTAGLPTEPGVDRKKLLTAVKSDKKRSDNGIKLVLIKDIGKCFVRQTSFEELENI